MLGSNRYYVDIIVIVSLLITVVCLWLSYRSRHSTRSQTERLMKDLASLQSAEDSLLSLQKQSVLYVFIYSADILIQFHIASALGAVVMVNTFWKF